MGRALLGEGGSSIKNAELLARVLHKAAFTQRSFTKSRFHTEKLVHREDFRHRSFSTGMILHRKAIHTEAFT